MFLDDLFDDETTLKTLYVSRKVVNFAEILNWAYRQGFPTTLDPTDFHVTICYSKSKFDWACTSPLRREVRISGDERSIHQFDGGAVVMTVQNDELADRWQQFIDLGASNSYKEYRPHITITYGDLPEAVVAFPGDIILGPEIWSEVNGGWKHSLEERPTGAIPIVD